MADDIPEPGGLNNLARRLAYGASTIPLAPLYLYTLPHALSGLAKAALGDPGEGASILPGDTYVDKGVRAYEDASRSALGAPESKNFVDNLEEGGGFAFLNPTALLSRGLPRMARGTVNAMMAAPESIAGKTALAAVPAGIKSAVLQMSEPEQPASLPIEGDSADVLPISDVPTAQHAASPGTLDVVDPVADEQDHNDRLSTVVKWGVPALVATGAAVLALRGRSARALAQQTSDLIGFAPKVDATPNTVKATGAFVNRTEPITSVFEQTDPMFADAMKDWVQLRLNPMAQAERLKSSYRDGTLPYSTLRFEVTPKQWWDSYGSLDASEAKILNDGIAAANELNNRALGVTNVPQYSNTDLGNMIAAMRGNNTLARAESEYNSIMRTGLDFLHERGLLTAQQHSDLAAMRPNYMPELQAQKMTWFQKLARSLTESGDEADGVQLLDRLFTREGGQQQFFNPADAMEQYLHTIIRYADVNDVRRATLTAIDNAGRASAPGSVWRSVIERATAPGDDIITVREAGQFQYYKVNDPIIKTALQHMPQTVVPVINQMKRAYQTLTTGLGAPWFALRALTYDAWTAANLAPAGMKVGLFPGDVVGASVDALAGAFRGMYGHIVRGAANAFDASIRNDGVVATMLGPRNTASLARVLGDAYARGTLAMFEHGGMGGNTRFQEVRNVNDFYSMLKDVSPQYASDIPAVRTLWNGYKNLLDSFQNGSRLQALARNWRDGMTEQEQLKLFNQVRHLTGDFGEKGGGLVAGSVTSAIPYANVTAQTVAQYGRAFRDNPLRFGTAMTLSTGLPAAYVVYNLANLGPEYVDYYFKQLTPEQRSTFIPVFIPGVRPEDAPRVPVPQEMRPYISVIVQGMDALFGISNGRIHSGEMASVKEALDTFFTSDTMRKDVQAGVSATLMPAPPPAINAIANVLGKSIDTGGAEGLGVHDISDNRMSGEQGYRVPITADADAITRTLENNTVAAVVTSLLGAAGQSAWAFMRSTDQSAREGAPLVSASAHGLRDLALDVQQKVPEGNLLWQAPQRLSSSTVEARLLRDKTDALTEIKRIVATDIVSQPATQSGTNRVQLPYGVPKGIADPAMQPILVEADKFGQSLQQRVLAPVKQLQDQLRVLDTRPLDALEKSRERNLIVQQINSLNAAAFQEVRNREDDMSRRYGRVIRFDKLQRGTTLQSLDPLPLPSQLPLQ